MPQCACLSDISSGSDGDIYGDYIGIYIYIHIYVYVGLMENGTYDLGFRGG